VNTAQQHAHDPHWYSAALQQIAQARWRHEPLIVIAGPPGAGKTTLCRQVADRRGTRTFVVLVLDPPSSGDVLLRAIARELGLLSKNDGAVLALTRDELQQTIRRFLDGLASLHADCLIIVDESQRLAADAHDEIRALLDSPSGRGALLQVVLVGLAKDTVDHRADHQTDTRADDAARPSAPATPPIGPRLVTTPPAPPPTPEPDRSPDEFDRFAETAWSSDPLAATSAPAATSTPASSAVAPVVPPPTSTVVEQANAASMDVVVPPATSTLTQTNATTVGPPTSAEGDVDRLAASTIATGDDKTAPLTFWADIATEADVTTATAVADIDRSSEAEAQATKRRRRGIGFLNGLITVAVMGACGIAWWGIAHRNDKPRRDETAQAEPAPKPPRPEEKALAAIVAEVDAGTAAVERPASAPIVLPEGAGWTDEVARRAAALALRPDVEGLVALRAAVAARKTKDAADARQVDALLRQLDQSLEQARKRQLALDRRQLAATPPKSR
jgi:AAA domain